MKFKILIIDNDITRKTTYEMFFNSTNDIDCVFCSTKTEYLRDHINTPFDGYIVDLILENDWGVDASEVFKELQNSAPRPAPVFLVSNLWGETRVLDVLSKAGQFSLKVVQYIAWTEFLKISQQIGHDNSRVKALYNKIYFELMRWHQLSNFRPKGDQEINLLIVSDIQYSDPDASKKSTYAENEIAYALDTENIFPHFVVIAGDITHSGTPEQFALAKDRLENDLFKQIWSHSYLENKDRIILVPGNHDVNLRYSSCEDYYFDFISKKLVPNKNTDKKSHESYSMEPFRRFAHELTNDHRWISSESFTWYDRRFIQCGIVFYNVNTVSKLNHLCPTKASFDEGAFRAISRDIGVNRDTDLFRVAISHHGTLPFSMRSSGDVEVDNWDETGMHFFVNQGINLWIQGHYHKYNTSSINDDEFADNNLWLLHAPTLTIRGEESRGFCILKLTRNDGKVISADIVPFKYENGKFIPKPARNIYTKSLKPMT